MRGIRRISPALDRALRALALGAIIAVGGATVVTTLTGCEDENDPATHVEKLSDPIRRGPALKRLKQFYLDAMANDKNDRNGENVKRVRDAIVEPLAKMIVDGALDTQLTDKGEVLGILADSRDERAIPALVKALNDYKPDDKRPEDYDTKIGEVVLHLGEMVKSGAAKDNKEVNGALFGLFKRVEAHTLKAQHRGFFRILNNVLILIADPAWEADLIGMVEQPIKSAQTKAQKDLMTQVYWQVTAAEILGKQRSEKAIKPLIKVVMSPFKGNIAGTAMAALVKIGDPALKVALDLMNGKEADLMKYAGEEMKRAAKDQGQEEPTEAAAKKKFEEEVKNAYLDHAVVIAGNMGTKACVAPMLAVMNDEAAPKATKAMIAAQLNKLPKDAALIDAFKKVYAETKADEKLPDGSFAKEALISAGIHFFDKDLNEVIFAESLKLEGKKEDVIGVQAAVLSAAIRAATPDQWHYIEELQKKVIQEIPQAKGKDKFFVKNAKKGNKEEGPFTDKEIVAKILNLELEAGTAAPVPEKKEEKPAYEELNNFGAFATALDQSRYINAIRMGKKVLDECKVKVECYTNKLTDPEATKSETQMIGIKSSYMVGMLGGEAVKPTLIKMLPVVTSPDIRGSIGQIIVRHSPAGDDAAVEALTKWIDEAADSRDQEKIDTVKPYKMIVYVLENRK